MNAESSTRHPAEGVRSGALRPWVVHRCADQRALWRHARQRWYLYLPFVLVLLVAEHYLLFNVTASLPYRVVWLDRTSTPMRGDLVVYRFDGDELMHVRKGQRFFKRVVGMPGDVVSADGRRVFINGVEVGIAKQYTLDGHRLDPLAAGVIPKGHYYVQGSHEMSFDSRYRASGLVHASQIIGTAHVIL